MVERGAFRYQYDEAGRLTEKREIRDGFRPLYWKYRWNSQNQLTELLTPRGERWRYSYDAFGRRIRKWQVIDGDRKETATGLSPEPVASLPESGRVVGCAWLWSGDQLVEEAPLYADGTVAYERAVHWLYAPGALTPVARYERGQLHYVVADHLGTPRELLTEGGRLAWSSRSNTWGRAELWPLPAANDDEVRPDCPLRFPGQYADEESGLHYNRYRYYEPETGQYLMPDPIGLAGGLRSYGYVHNPLGWIDPLGLSDSSILDKAMGGSVGDRLSAHHVIPVEIWKENRVFLDQIGLGGKMNSASNGIHVPGSEAAMKADVGKGIGVFHSSNHNNYSNEVRDRISYISDRYYAGEITDRQARDMVRKVQMDMKNKIWVGNVSTTKCGRIN